MCGARDVRSSQASVEVQLELWPERIDKAKLGSQDETKQKAYLHSSAVFRIIEVLHELDFVQDEYHSIAMIMLSLQCSNFLP